MTFKEWFKEQEENGFYHDYYGSEAGFDAGVQIERERIRARVRLAAISSWSASEAYIGPPFIQLQKFVDRLLEDDDE